MKKKNIITPQEAEKIYKKIKKQATPSQELIDYAHNELLKNAHYLFQYKINRKRFGYCTYCREDFPLEIEALRTYTDNDVAVLEAKHNESVICPCCGKRVTKRYAGIARKNVYASVAEFNVDENGGLIVYVYQIFYDYEKDFHIKNPDWYCWRIGYFDIHRYFHDANGYFSSCLYFDDKYTKDLNFTNSNIVVEPLYYNQERHEGIHCFNLNNALLKSNLKYSCLMEYMGEKSATDMFGFLKFYCSYPEITEKLIKEGYKETVKDYLYGQLKGCFNFRAQTVKDFFKLDKQHMKLLKNYTLTKHRLKAMQFIQRNGFKCDKDIFEFVSDFCEYRNLIGLMLRFVGFQKMQTYVKKQDALCRCQYYSFTSFGYEFFQNYSDYIKQCIQLNYDLTDKNIVMPSNLFSAHCELTDLLSRKKAEEKARENAKKLKAFEKRLLKLQKKYTYSDGVYLIRPAAGYEELCKEGTTLHHCVYTNYAEPYISGKTDILLVRKVTEPDKPFYTLEYNHNTIVQCRTLYNESANDEINAFLKKWKAFIKSNNKTKKEVA